MVAQGIEGSLEAGDRSLPPRAGGVDDVGMGQNL